MRRPKIQHGFQAFPANGVSYQSDPCKEATEMSFKLFLENERPQMLTTSATATTCEQ